MPIFAIDSGVCKLGGRDYSVHVPVTWVTPSEDVVAEWLPATDCDATVPAQRVRMLNYPGDGGAYLYTVPLTSTYPQESPIWLEDGLQPLTSSPLFVVATKKCSVECFALGMVEGERPGPAVASSEFMVFPPTARPLVVQSFPLQW